MTAAASSRQNPVVVLVPLIVLSILAGIGVFILGRNDEGTTNAEITAGRSVQGSGQSEQSQARAREPRLEVEGEGQNLFDLVGRGEPLTSFVDKRVRGENLEVQEVVNQNLVWVGRNTERRVLVSIATNSPQVRATDSNDGDEVELEVGTLIEIEGVIRGLQANLNEVQLTDANDASELQSQGAYVYAETLVTDS